MSRIDFTIPELDAMKKIPVSLSYKGNTDLLYRRKVAIIGSRQPNQYTQYLTHKISQELSRVGVCIVSGAAMGVDAIAHRGAGSHNTIAVLPCGIDLRYPAINKSLLASIEAEGLTLSQFEDGFKATNWSFVVRNEVVVALGEVLIVTQADEESGSMRSAEYALEMGKKIYVFPHRIGESEGTNRLLAEGKAEAIYDMGTFVSRFGKAGSTIDLNDPFLRFCATSPVYEDAVQKFGEKIFEAELNGVIEVQNGRVVLM